MAEDATELGWADITLPRRVLWTLLSLPSAEAKENSKA